MAKAFPGAGPGKGIPPRHSRHRICGVPTSESGQAAELLQMSGMGQGLAHEVHHGHPDWRSPRFQAPFLRPSGDAAHTIHDMKHDLALVCDYLHIDQFRPHV